LIIYEYFNQSIDKAGSVVLREKRKEIIKEWIKSGRIKDI
jgi:hypothetical protein